MMDHLVKIDPSKMIYETPIQCLESFLNHLTNMTSSYNQKSENISQLLQQVKQL